MITSSDRLLQNMLPVHPHLSLFEQSQLILDSFRRITGRDLLSSSCAAQYAESLFFAPIAVVSHGVEADPVLNYGNRKALELWEMDWEEFIRTPSRLTAEPVDREERDRLLERVSRSGFIDDYSGVRISKHGRRFRIDHAMVWNLIDPAGIYRGQAAAFEKWEYL